ncbi:MAG TPA: hypothetical protein PLL53_05870, partial [Saprospiraceae bacterium]|nr:hypothetical protein [Saprospiraceae bacterium]
RTQKYENASDSLSVWWILMPNLTEKRFSSSSQPDLFSTNNVSISPSLFGHPTALSDICPIF